MGTTNNEIANKLKGTYTDASFDGAFGVKAIRQDISRYLSSTDIRGIVQMFREILENSLDELKEIIHQLGDLAKDKEFTIFVNIYKDASIRIKDCGRGIPTTLKSIEGITKPIICFTFESDTFGGKSSKGKGYSTKTGGVHGAGSCVTNAGSEFLQITNTVLEDGKSYKLQYKKGECTVPLTEIPVRKKADGTIDSGLEVYMKYDEEMFNLFDADGKERDFPFDIQDLLKLFKGYALALDKINIDFTWELPDGTTGHEVIKSSDYDPRDLLAKVSKTGEIYTYKTSYEETEETSRKYKTTPLNFELTMHTTHSTFSKAMSIINMIDVERSSVKTAFFQALGESVSKRFKTYKSYNPNVPIPLDLERNHVSTVLNLEIENPEFASQVKTEYINARLLGVLKDDLAKYFTTHPDGQALTNQVFKSLIPAYETQLATYMRRLSTADKRKADKFKRDALKNNKPAKRLTVPKDCIYQNSFLLIIEGDSACDRVKQTVSKLPPVFATFKIRGRITNVLINDILDSKDVSNKQMFEELVRALAYPWKRVIFMTDGDADGQQIKDLLTIYMMENEPKLLLTSRVSHIQAPAVKFVVRAVDANKQPIKRSVFVFNKEVLPQVEEKYKDNILSSVAYKGLAEISVQDLTELLSIGKDGSLNYELVLRPATRDMELEKEIYGKFYGESTYYRQQFILEQFATQRFTEYFNTRKSRLKDISFKTEIDRVGEDYLNNTGVIRTSELLESNDTYTDELDTEYREMGYYQPIEYMLEVQKIKETFEPDTEEPEEDDSNLFKDVNLPVSAQEEIEETTPKA